jgi:hypothetical protein
MPGLLRGVARTAVIAGTASAVSGRVQRRQSERFAERDAQIDAERTHAYQQTMPSQPAAAPPPPAATPPPPAAGRSETLAQLQQLGELKAQGILTDEEFAAEKARILGS